MKLVRVVARTFVAGFETDGIVRRTAPILKRLKGKTDAEARAFIARRDWKASVVPDQIAFDLSPPGSGSGRPPALPSTSSGER